jgi:hypothetical protein
MSGHPISDHIERFVGPVDHVEHDFDPRLPIHIHHVQPAKSRPYHALVTEGMSYSPLKVRRGDEEFRFQELMILMPRSWRRSDKKTTWPLFWLRHLAQYAHREKTYYAYGHSFGNGPNCDPLAPGVEMCGWLFLPPIELEEKAKVLPIDEKHQGRLIALVPVYRDEYRHIVDENGLNDVLDGFERDGVSELYNPKRKSVLVKTRSRGVRV